MLEKLTVGLALRALAREVAGLRVQAIEANRLAALALKLEALRADVSLAALEAAEDTGSAGDPIKPAVESLSQTDKDFAQREAMQELMDEFFKSLGRVAPADLDPIQWAKKEGYLEREKGEVDEDVPEIRVFGRPVR